jgi:hypothetical protein
MPRQVAEPAYRTNAGKVAFRQIPRRRVLDGTVTAIPPFTGNSRDIRFALADHGIDTGTFRRMSFLKMERAALAAAL